MFKEIRKLLPDYDYMYLGDNARAPYGGRGKEKVTSFSREAVKFLFDKGCHLVLFACYTASSLALRELQKEFLRAPGITDKKILGVIRPVVEHAAKHSRKGAIGIVATRATIDSKALETELKNLKPELKIFPKACPLLVPLIEEHWHKTPEARMILKKYLRSLKNANIDTLILGCTHYPLMMSDFKRFFGKKVDVLNGGKIVAESLVNYLERHHEIKSLLSKNGRITYYTTDDPERFFEFGRYFAKVPIEKVERVSLS